MSLFFKEKETSRPTYNKYGAFKGYDKKTVKSPTKLGRTILCLSAGVSLIGIFSESHLDALGDRNTAKAIPEAEVNAEALSRVGRYYDEAFKNASPAGKFALQYLTSTSISTEVRDTEPNNGKSLLGALTGTIMGDTAHIVVTRGDACLSQTAWDINGGNISGIINGIFTHGEIEGDIPTAAASAKIDETNADVLIVQSGNSNSWDLRFSGLTEGGALIPADEQTEQVLFTHGCDPGSTQYTKYAAAALAAEQDSPWINR